MLLDRKKNSTKADLHAFFVLLAETLGVLSNMQVQTIAAHKLFGIITQAFTLPQDNLRGKSCIFDLIQPHIFSGHSFVV